jgi:prepilin-type N-terminal cleavage/methylation domain-containing protein
MNTVRRHPEGGFTMTEMLVAVMILSILVVAFGRALSASIQTSRDHQVRQQANALGMEYVETARSRAWDELALTSIDPSAPFLNAAGDGLDAGDVGLEADEALVVSATGLIAPKSAETINGADFTVWTYVSTFGNLRRLMVLVEWELEEGLPRRSHRLSTVVSPVTTS